MPGFIRSAGLRGAARLCEAIGIDPQAVAREVGLPEPALEDPDFRIRRVVMADFLREAAARSGLTDFGLRACEFRGLDEWGLLGLAARDQETVGGFLEIFRRHLSYHNDSLVVSLRLQEGMAELAFDFGPIDAEASRHGMEGSLAYLVRWLRHLVDPDWAPDYVTFLHVAPPGLATHRRVLGVEPVFAQEEITIGFPRSLLSQPVKGARPEHNATTLGLLEKAPSVAASYGEVVRSNLRALVGRADFSAETMARLCGLTPRTLHRKLVAEGASYTRILDEVRAEMARAHVAGSRRPLAEVADILGFSSQSAFAHWYRALHGESANRRRSRAAA